MWTAFAAVPGGFGSVFKFGWLATNPSHKALDGRMRTQRFGCRVFVGQFLLAESPMQHPVTNNMNVVGRLAAFRFWKPVMAIDARSFDHLSPANRAGAERAGWRVPASHVICVQAEPNSSKSRMVFSTS